MFISCVFDILGKVSKSKLHFHCLVISVLKIILNFMLFSLNFWGETKALRGGYSECWL